MMQNLAARELQEEKGRCAGGIGAAKFRRHEPCCGEDLRRDHGSIGSSQPCNVNVDSLAAEAMNPLNGRTMAG